MSGDGGVALICCYVEVRLLHRFLHSHFIDRFIGDILDRFHSGNQIEGVYRLTGAGGYRIDVVLELGSQFPGANRRDSSLFHRKPGVCLLTHDAIVDIPPGSVFSPAAITVFYLPQVPTSNHHSKPPPRHSAFHRKPGVSPPTDLFNFTGNPVYGRPQRVVASPSDFTGNEVWGTEYE